MAKYTITDFVTYRWRYQLGFAALGLSILILLVVVLFFTPGGLSKAEMHSAVMSSQVSLNTVIHPHGDELVHLPYRLLQKASIALFGVSNLSIKLPSLVMGFTAALALYGIVRLWFRRSVAIITAILGVTTGIYLLSTQTGTPMLAAMFWSSLVLFFAAMLARPSRFKPLWVICLGLTAALSLYTPFQIYLLIALAATGLIHPHARYIISRQPKWVLAIGILVFALVTTPLILASVRDPSFLLTLIGWPEQITTVSAWQHLMHYVDVYNTSSSTVVQPVYGLGMLLLGAIGVYKLFTTNYTAKSYIITIWGVCLLPFIVTRPDAVTSTFLPFMILVGQGTDYLIRSWYRLFPRNPYARVAGLIPLAILVAALGLSGADRFLYGYHYNPQAATSYPQQLQLVNKSLDVVDQPATLLVSSDELAFYRLYAAHSSSLLQVTDTLSDVRQATTLITKKEFRTQLSSAPNHIVVGSLADSPNRLYVYKNQQH